MEEMGGFTERSRGNHCRFSGGGTIIAEEKEGEKKNIAISR